MKVGEQRNFENNRATIGEGEREGDAIKSCDWLRWHIVSHYGRDQVGGGDGT